MSLAEVLLKAIPSLHLGTLREVVRIIGARWENRRWFRAGKMRSLTSIVRHECGWANLGWPKSAVLWQRTPKFANSLLRVLALLDLLKTVD